MLAARGLQVVAVEPLAEMRAEFARAVPGIDVLEGSAESIPLGDGSVEAVVAAQAWHWVEPARAAPAVGRVLSPGGWLGLVWNVRDERVDWVAELGRIMAMGQEEDDDFGVDSDPQGGAPFGALEQLRVEWTHNLGPAALLDLVGSRSYVITLPDARRSRVLGEVRDLVEAHPSLAGRHEIAMPYVTREFRTHTSGSR